jgi:hypothetical protein
MALWSTLVAHSDRPEEFDRLMKEGIEGHEVTEWEPGVYIVHGPQPQEKLDALASRSSLKVFTRETDIVDLEKHS